MPTKTICILGAGGHARVVIDSMASSHPDAVIRVFDDAEDIVGSKILGIEIEQWSGSFMPDVVVHVAIGHNEHRRRRAEQIIDSGFGLGSVISARATIARSATQGDGIFVAPGAIVGPEAAIGRATIVNHNAVVDHESVIGCYCHIAPGATLAGRCRVGDGTLVGAGANVLPGIVLGAGVTVAAGAVVVRDVADGETVAGLPARPVRK